MSCRATHRRQLLDFGRTLRSALWPRIVVAVLALRSLALASTAVPAAYSQRIWQMQDGLPEQVVQAFAQTADHYLWIGTTGGLVRFDGGRFVVFDRDNTPAFLENNVFCLTVSRNNTLWIGTEGGGLIRYRDGVFRVYGTNDGLNNGFVRAIYEDRTGRIWVGTDSGLYVFRGDRLYRVDGNADGRMPPVAVHALLEDRQGRLWVGGSHLLRQQGPSFVEYRLAGRAGPNRVKTILETEDGTVWVGTVSGLHKLRAASSEFHVVREISGTVRFLRETSDHTLWIGMIGRGLHTLRDGRFATMRAPSGLPSNTVLNLFEDTEHNIWIGTQAGMVRLSRSPVHTLNLPDAADSDAETVYQDPDGDVWIAAENLFRIHQGRTMLYHVPGLAGARVRNVFRDLDGNLWFGTEGRGVYREMGTRLLHYSTENGLVNNFVRAILQAKDKSVWIATDEGVSRWRPQGFTNYQMADGLCYFSIRSILEDHEGGIWIGTDRGISHIDRERFESDGVTEALKNEKIWAIHENPEGAMWFGTQSEVLFYLHCVAWIEQRTPAHLWQSNAVLSPRRNWPQSLHSQSQP